jgi:MFS transporter, PAT family, beta-lactamase induction signal transducer AmpG
MPFSSLNIRRLAIILLLGFSSGLPIALVISTLQAWFTVSGISIVTIGILSLVGQPYIYKFLWAPFFDRYVPPLFGRRRGWMIITQAALTMGIIALAYGDPIHHAIALSLLALLVAFLSASQDIAIDAYRTDITTPEERGLSASLFVGGYRVAMMVSGGLALVLAAKMGWRETYLIMASLMLIGLIASFLGKEPAHNNISPPSLYAAIVEPFKEFLSRKNACLILLLLIFYKFGDALSMSLITPFLLRGLNFSLSVVGTVNKGVGIGASIVGLFIGGIIMTRLSLYRSLFLFGILQIIAIVMLLQLAIVGKNYPYFVAVVTADNLFNGMGTTALFALLMSLCNQRYTATQFALFTTCTSIPRVLIGPMAAVMVEHVGWIHFFAWSIVFSLPGLYFLWRMRDKIDTPLMQTA